MIPGQRLPTDIATPQDWLLPNGVMRLMPAAEIDQWSRDAIRVWCHRHARYGLPTVELVSWLNDQIGGRSVLEIGSGAGDLAHHLGIRATDNKIQESALARYYYDAMQQPVIAYPDWVERIDALAAIDKYQPEIVIACWVTHWIDPNAPPPPGGGSMFGVREDQLISRGVEYVLIGNAVVHQYKPILRFPHQTLTFPFIRSRAAKSDADRVFIWNGG